MAKVDFDRESKETNDSESKLMILVFNRRIETTDRISYSICFFTILARQNKRDTITLLWFREEPSCYSVMAAAEVGALAGRLTRRMRAPGGPWPRLFGRASPRPNHGKMFCKHRGRLSACTDSKGRGRPFVQRPFPPFHTTTCAAPRRCPARLSVCDKITGLFTAGL